MSDYLSKQNSSAADNLQAETRREALKTLQAALLGQLGTDGPAHTVWAYWECPVDPAEEQTKGIKRVARELEAEVVKQSHTTADFRELSRTRRLASQADFGR
jgi:hypothetical protein